MTNGDNSNILVARVARETFGIERVVARIYDPRRAAIYQRLGIATVAPALWTTERVLRRLRPERRCGRVGRSRARRCRSWSASLGTGWAGHRLLDVERDGVRVVAVSRLGSAMLPTTELVVQEGDVRLPRGRARRHRPISMSTSARRLPAMVTRSALHEHRHRRWRQRRPVHRRAARAAAVMRSRSSTTMPTSSVVTTTPCE